MDIRQPIPTIYGDWLSRFGEAWKTQVDELRSKYGEAIEEVRVPPAHPVDVPVVYVRKERVIDVLRFMKAAPGFEYGFLADLTAIDEQPREPRFELIYNLFSPSKRWRIRVKARVGEGEEMPTLVPVWSGADWAEREVYDMFGIRFIGHPNMRRILMDYRYEGYPLRKDFPLRSNYQIFTDPAAPISELLED